MLVNKARSTYAHALIGPEITRTTTTPDVNTFEWVFQELHNASQIRIRVFSSFLVALNGCARPLTIGALFKSVWGPKEIGPPAR